MLQAHIISQWSVSLLSTTYKWTDTCTDRSSRRSAMSNSCEKTMKPMIIHVRNCVSIFAGVRSKIESDTWAHSAITAAPVDDEESCDDKEASDIEADMMTTLLLITSVQWVNGNRCCSTVCHTHLLICKSTTNNKTTTVNWKQNKVAIAIIAMLTSSGRDVVWPQINDHK